MHVLKKFKFAIFIFSRKEMAVNYGHFSKFFEAHFYLLLLHWDDWTWTMNVMFHPFSLVRVPTIIFFLEKITNSTVKTWILSRVRQLKNWTSRFPKMEFLFLSVGDDTISFPKGWNHLPPSSVHILSVWIFARYFQSVSKRLLQQIFL